MLYQGLPSSIAFVLALVPACVVWWYGRSLAGTLDDPLLPERLQASRLPGRYALAFSWALLVVLWPGDYWWTVPLMIAARAAAAYPLRRALYGETWGLAGYLWFFLRLAVAFYGFWLTLLWLPHFESGAPSPFNWVAAFLLAALLISWSQRYSVVACRVLGTRPVDDEGLVSGLRQLAERAGLVPPRFEILDMKGGVLANAVALPSRRSSAVLITSTLVERFDRREILAVLAHELAHIEHFDARRLKRLNLATYILIATGVLIAPVTSLVLPSAQFELSAVWFVGVLVYLAIRARSKQKEETASDLRAVELTGDGEALASALIKLHTIGRVPRRWESNAERQATHPSLAHRIQAIRASAANVAPSGPTADRVPSFESPVAIAAGSASVMFHDDRLEWREGDLLTHTFGYAHLTELRISAQRGGFSRLVALEKSGRRWEAPIGDADIARVEAVLDVVDTRLAAAPSRAAVPVNILRVLAVFTASIALTTMQFAVLLPLGFALLRPTLPLAVAAGAAAISAGGLAWRNAGLGGIESFIAWPAVMLVLCGCALLGLAWAKRKDDEAPKTSQAFVALAAVALLVWGTRFATGFDAVRLHQTMRAGPSPAVLALSLAAGLAVRREKKARAASIPAFAAGLLALAIGSRTYLQWFGHDLFLASAGPLTIKTVDARLLSESSLPVRGSRLQLSPSARRLAVSTSADTRRTRFYVGPTSGPFQTFQGDDVLFVDDDRLLIADWAHEGSVREVRFGSSGSDIEWEQRVPSLMSANLWLDRPTKAWRLLGRSRDGEIVRIEGTIGESALQDRRWTARDEAGQQEYDWVNAVAATHTHLLTVRTHYDGLDNPLSILTAMVEPTSSESRFTVIGPSDVHTLGASRLEVDCRGLARGDERAICAAFDGTRTTFFELDLAAARLEPVGSLPGRFNGSHDGGTDWLIGWWNGGPLAVNTQTREAWRFPESAGPGAFSIAVADNVIGSVSVSGTKSVVRLYWR